MLIPCPACNLRISESQPFCLRCGHPIATGATEPPNQEAQKPSETQFAEQSSPPQDAPSTCTPPDSQAAPTDSASTTAPAAEKPTTWWATGFYWIVVLGSFALWRFAGLDLLLHGVMIAIGCGLAHLALKGPRRAFIGAVGILLSQSLVPAVGLALTFGFLNLGTVYYIDLLLPSALAGLLVTVPRWPIVIVAVAIEAFHLCVHIAALAHWPPVLQMLQIEVSGHEAGLSAWALSRLIACAALVFGILEYKAATRPTAPAA
jgi:hypothetical protein